MIALDTNLLVRFLVDDDAAQREQVGHLVRSATDEHPVVITNTVVVEAVWVLTSVYGFGREAVATVIEGVLEARQFRLPSHDLVAAALESYRRGRGGFADYIIQAEARAAGCDKVATFDKKLLEEAGFRKP